MKKSLLLASFGLATILFAASCSKDDDQPTQNQNGVTVQGVWSGNGQYGTSGGNPTYAFSLNFKANGTVDITGNNSTGVDVATGTWTIVGDSVRATYVYAASSATYTLSGKYSSASNVMAGTIGLGSVTAGVGIFSVVKQ